MLTNLDEWVFATHVPTIGEVADMQAAQRGDVRAMMRWLSARYKRPLSQVRELTFEHVTVLMKRAAEGIDAVTDAARQKEDANAAAIQAQLDAWMKQMKQTERESRDESD